MVLTVDSNGVLAQKEGDSFGEGQVFTMVKHPDQKKYMHYALQNADGMWLAWDQSSGQLKSSPKISWFAMLPVNENKPQESGWLIKQDKFYLSMPKKDGIEAKTFASVPKARELNQNKWNLVCADKK